MKTVNKKGFTLVELLAVIVILGVLFSLSTIAINSIRKKQDIKNAKNVISGILTAAKRYESDHQYEDVGSEISVSDLDELTDYDKKKYSELGDKKIKITECSTNANNVKLKFEISGLEDVFGSNTYNDCGCKDQSNSSTDELCTD